MNRKGAWGMQTTLCGVSLHYEQYGTGDKHILMLHGWG